MYHCHKLEVFKLSHNRKGSLLRCGGMETEDALTYQPFAIVPKLDKLRDELFHNVAQPERVISIIGGIAALVSSVRRRSPLGVVLALVGGALMLRGASGHCPLYTAMGKEGSGA